MKRTVGQTMSALALMASFGAPALAQTTPPPVASAPVSAPQAAAAARPNIIVWMLDDVGFAQLSSYGGLVETPNIDRLARRGVRFTNYHTAPICSASRAAMLTGRNPHSVHMGGHAAAQLPFPGYDSIVPAEDGTIAANLRAAGYVTAAMGKWDHLPSGEMTPAGPFTHWPTGQGFDQFYGFIGADADNWEPVLINGAAPVTTPRGAAYHLNNDLADRAIALFNGRSAQEAAAPVFLYFATGTAHAPHHAPQRWIDHYRGRFAMGWDAARATILRQQIAQGLIPAGAQLAPRPEGVPAWSSLPAADQALYARQMEVFAAALSHADEQFGRILDALESRGELDNTIIVVTSDNGASAEGAQNGTHNETLFMNGYYPDAAENRRFIDQWGGPATQPHYAYGWAVAGNTPFRNYKQTTHEGGTRVPLVISWPQGIAARGEVRQQFAYVADIAPTLLQLTSVSPAAMLNNIVQTPMEGLSLLPQLRGTTEPAPSRSQYFEMYGNRALWSDGWVITTSHRLDTWRMDQSGPFNEPWELYDLRTDPGQTRNLAAAYPDRVQAMAAMFDEQAQRYNVLPLSNIGDSRVYAMRAFQGEMGRRQGRWTYTGPVSNIGSFAAPPIAFRPYTMTAQLTLASPRDSGPIFAFGGSSGGMAAYLAEGVPMVALRDLSGGLITVRAPHPLAAGARALSVTIARTPTPMRPEQVTITIASGEQTLVTQQVTATIPAAYGVAETFDIGIDRGSAVSSDYAADQPFAGTIGTVTFQIR